MSDNDRAHNSAVGGGSADDPRFEQLMAMMADIQRGLERLEGRLEQARIEPIRTEPTQARPIGAASTDPVHANQVPADTGHIVAPPRPRPHPQTMGGPVPPGPVPRSGPVHPPVPGPGPGLGQGYPPGAGYAPGAGLAGSVPQSASPGYAYPEPPVAPTTRMRTSTILGVIGGTVLLLGIAFLLVFAAQAGFFGPVPRVVAAFVLGGGLIAGGVVLRRRARNTSAALALVGTGYAAVILDFIAATSLYHFFSTVAGYVLVGVMALAGLGLAWWWRSSLLAALTGCGAMLLAPMLSVDITLVVFVTIIGAVMTATGWRHPQWLRLLRTVIPVLYYTGALILVAAEMTVSGAATDMGYGVCTLVFALVVMATTVVEAIIGDRRDDLFAMVNVPLMLPLIVLGVVDFGGVPTWLVYVLVAAVYLGVSGVLLVQWRARRSAVTVAAVLGTIGVLCAARALASTADSLYPFAAISAAIALMVAAVRIRRIWLTVFAALVAGGACVQWLGTSGVHVMFIASFAVSQLTWMQGVTSVVMLAGLVVATKLFIPAVAPNSVVPLRNVLVAAMVLVAALVTVTFGVVIGRAVDDEIGGATGFFVGHLLVTVLMICGAAVLVLTRTTSVVKPRVMGFVLGGVALAKLFLFDLSMLPAVLRIVAFMIVGGVLLLVAMRYTDSETERSGHNDRHQRQHGPTAAQPGAGQPGGNPYGPPQGAQYQASGLASGPGPGGNSGQM